MNATKSGYTYYLTITLALYIGLYGSFLAYTDGLPYVIDNNESFSSLWHAYNLYHFSFRDSCGLTDEAFSTFPEAHPYVHTHQGNFPRIFSLLLFALNAQSIQSQIVITTLTVGLATIALGFHVFARRVNPFFAFIAMTVLMSDYVMFGQWMVNTYRVWHAFLLFGALVCVESAQKGRMLWALSCTSVFWSVYYYEFVFAFFITVTTCAYAVLLYWNEKRVILRLALYCGAGAVLGAGVLFLQLVAYMGWEATIQDVIYTIRARQYTTDSTRGTDQLFEFYRSHNIIFWPNFTDGSILRSPTNLAFFTVEYHFGAFSPLLWMPAWLIAGGFLFGRLADKLQRYEWMKKFPTPVSVPSWSIAGGVYGLGYAGLLSCFIISFSRFARHLSSMYHPDVHPYVSLTTTIGIPLLFSLLAFLATSQWVGKSTFLDRSLRVVLACGLLIGVHTVGIRFLTQPEGPTLGILESWHTYIGLLVVNASASVFAFVLVLGGRSALPLTATLPLERIGTYLLAGILGYLAASFVMGGYVLSGYLERWVSFFVCFSDIILAIATYLVIHCAAVAWRLRSSTLSVSALINNRLPRVPRLAAAMGSAALLGSLVMIWTAEQAVHLTYLSPDQQSFLATLSEPPYRGAGCLTNAYGAPPSAMMQRWAYMDPWFRPGNVQLGETGYLMEKQTSLFLWLKDLAKNPEYLRPAYVVSINSQNLRVETDRIRSSQRAKKLSAHTIRCAAEQLTGLTTNSTLNHKLVNIDDTGLNRWAIAKLDWDFPPYLERLPGMMGGESVSSRLRKTEAGHVVDFDYKYAHQDGTPEKDSIVRIFHVPTPGSNNLLAEGHLKSPFLIDPTTKGNIQISVTPCTATKRGMEYFSNYVPVEDCPSFQAPYLEASSESPLAQTVKVELIQAAETSRIKVYYTFAQEHGEKEADSILRLYLQDKNGTLVLLDQTTGQDTIEVPPLPAYSHDDPGAQLRIAVIPRTSFAKGREYLSAQKYPASSFRCASVTSQDYSQAPRPFAVAIKKDTKITLIKTTIDHRWQADHPYDEGRLQMHVLLKDGSFQLIRDLIDEKTFVVETGLYDVVRVTLLPLEPDGTDPVGESMLFDLR